MNVLMLHEALRALSLELCSGNVLMLHEDLRACVWSSLV